MFSLGLKIGEVVNIHVKDFKKYDTGFLVHIRKASSAGYYSKVPSNCLNLVNKYLSEWHIKGFLSAPKMPFYYPYWSSFHQS